MLFSSTEVAGFINDNFEPAWESVRPAPLISIDFGNGNVVKRTLQGNIATYVCAADGVVHDVLPGIYSPEEYRKQLERLRTVAESASAGTGDTRVTSLGDAVRTAIRRAKVLSTYHAQEAARLALLQQPAQFRAIALTGGGFKGGGAFGGNLAGGGGFQIGSGGFQISGGWAPNGAANRGIEGPTERVIAGLPALSAPATASIPLAKRPELTVDSQVNELIRRKAIHERLKQSGPVHPDDIKKWLFKEVLHADLDDPLLGLGPVLNSNYPFAEEDRGAGRSPSGP